MVIFQYRSLLVGLVFIGMLGSGKAEQITNETNSYAVARIAALNKVILECGSNAVSAQTEIQFPTGEKKTFIQIKEELALYGVTIRVVDGRYIDVSRRVANGHSLNSNDQKQLAILNELQEAYCMNLQPNQLIPGEIRASMNVIKDKLKEHGISLRLDDDLFIVDSMRNEVRRSGSNNVVTNVPNK